MDKKPLMKFKPDEEADHSDWVLVLDDDSMKFPDPGL